MKSQSRRQKPAMPPKLMSWNNPTEESMLKLECEAIVQRKGMIAEHLWRPAACSPVGLSHQIPWSTDVSLAAPYW